MSLQHIIGGVQIPGIETMQVSQSTILMDAASEKAGFVFQAPKTGQISKVYFEVATYTSGADADVRIETVDVTNGFPSGTLWATNTNGSVTIGSTGIKNVTLTANASVNQGDFMALVISQPASSPGNWAIRDGNTGNHIPYSLIYTTSWSNRGRQPVCALEYNDGSFSPIAGGKISGINSALFNSGSTPDHIGLRFKLPFPARLLGVHMAIELDGDANITLFDADGSTILTSLSLDSDVRFGTGGAPAELIFPQSVKIKANRWYRIAIVPTTVTSVRYYYQTIGVELGLDAIAGGKNFHLTTAKDPTSESSWTQTLDQAPLIGITIDQFHDGQVHSHF